MNGLFQILRRRTSNRIFAALVALGAVLCFSSGCDRNVAKSQAPADLAGSAQEDMEAGRYEEAQAKCEEHLEKAPEDFEVRSLLGAAHAAQGGLVLFTILIEASNQSAAASGSGTDAASVGAYLPAATLENVERLTQANAQMALIPAVDRTTAMTVQASLFLLFDSILRLKYLQENPAALAALSVADAKLIIGNIAKAAVLAAGGSNPFAQFASTTSAAVAAVPGADEKSKLTNYVARTSLVETVALFNSLYEDDAITPLSKDTR